MPRHGGLEGWWSRLPRSPRSPGRRPHEAPDLSPCVADLWRVLGKLESCACNPIYRVQHSPFPCLPICNNTTMPICPMCNQAVNYQIAKMKPSRADLPVDKERAAGRLSRTEESPPRHERDVPWHPRRRPLPLQSGHAVVARASRVLRCSCCPPPVAARALARAPR